MEAGGTGKEAQEDGMMTAIEETKKEAQGEEMVLTDMERKTKKEKMKM